MAAFNPTWTPGYDQSGRFCWYNKATGRVHHPSRLDALDRRQQPQQQQQQQRRAQGLSMAPDEDVGLLCDVAHPNVPTGSYFSLRGPEFAKREEAGVFTQREKRGLAWERDCTREKASTQKESCLMYMPFADHNKPPVALEPTKPRRPQPTYSQREWRKPLSKTPVPRGRPGFNKFDKSMPPPLPRPARGRPPLSQRGGGRVPAPPAFSETHYRCRGGNARVNSPHRQAVGLWGESQGSI